MQCFLLLRKYVFNVALFFPLSIIAIIYVVFISYNYTTIKVNFGIYTSKQKFSNIPRTEALIKSLSNIPRTEALIISQVSIIVVEYAILQNKYVENSKILQG